MSDPRVYFAAERTLLAWVRTGIAVMAFGFVVARFGLVLDLLPEGRTVPTSRLSPYLGAALAILGVISIAAGAAHYQHYTRSLPPEDMPTPHASRLPLALAWSLVVLGGVLVVVLLI